MRAIRTVFLAALPGLVWAGGAAAQSWPNDVNPRNDSINAAVRPLERMLDTAPRAPVATRGFTTATAAPPIPILDWTPPPAAAPAPAPPMVPPAPPVASVPPGLDGTYIGEAVAAPRQRACRPQRMNMSMTVSNGHAVLAVDRRRQVEADLAPDGSVSFNTDMGTVMGKVANTGFTGQGVRMGVCNYNFSLQRQG